MNIGKESNFSINESNAVSILSNKLQSNSLIKCYFSENDKTPNTDGHFTFTDNNHMPIKEFKVQIKSVEKMQFESNGDAYYDCDTKFINYANINVTDNPCIIFVVNLETNNIYFKYLSETFLKEHEFLLTSEQKTIRLHFNNYEKLIDINIFTNLLREILKSRNIQKFRTKNIDVYEYQQAFDSLNSFFDKDFLKLKNIAFPNVWKLGIACKREHFEKETYENLKEYRSTFGIETAPFSTRFSVYEIKYGANFNIFQNLEPSFDSKDLKFNQIQYSNGSSFDISEEVKKWLSDRFKRLIKSKNSFIPFVPNDALFEIVFNFLDKLSEFNRDFRKDGYKDVFKKDIVNIDEIKEIFSKHKSVSNDFILIDVALKELSNRDIQHIQRVWIHKVPEDDYIFHNHFLGININNMKKNNEKLFTNMPLYYNEFLERLFDNNKLKYENKGNYTYCFETNLNGNILNNYYKYIKIESENFSVNCCNEINENSHDSLAISWGSGMVKASFRNDKTNILNNLLSLLYYKVCDVYNLEKDASINLDADFK